MRIVYIENKTRGDRLLPLLTSHSVVLVRSWRDVLRCRRSQFDAVLVDQFGTPALKALALLGIGRQRALVLRVRGDITQEFAGRRNGFQGVRTHLAALLNWRIAGILGRLASAVVVNSEYLRDKLARRWPDWMYYVVHNPCLPLGPVDVTRRSENLHLRVLSVTNFNYWPKVEPMFEFLYELVKSGAATKGGFEWTVVGGGYLLPKFWRAVEKAGLRDRVRVTGSVDDVRPYLEQSHVFLHLTRLDAFPNVTMEAMAAGLPVIVNHDSCGAREQIEPGRTGTVVQSIADVQDAIALYGDTLLRTAHGSSGMSHALSRFGVARLRSEMDAVLQAVGAGRRRHRPDF